MVGRFVARCKRGHELIEFTDPTEFERHMTGEHGAKKMRPGDGWGERAYRTRGAYIRPGEKPYQWKAPAVPKDWRARLAAVLDKAGHDVSDVHTDYVIRPNALIVGDVFTLGGECYRVLDADSDRLEIEQADRPDRRRWFGVDEITAKRDRVRIVKRAA